MSEHCYILETLVADIHFFAIALAPASSIEAGWHQIKRLGQVAINTTCTLQWVVFGPCTMYVTIRHLFGYAAFALHVVSAHCNPT